MLQIGQLLQIEAITPNQCTEVVTGSWMNNSNSSGGGSVSTGSSSGSW